MKFALTTALLALCALSPRDGGRADEQPEDVAESVWEYLALKYDADHDGRVSREEYTRGEVRWKRLDKSADGFLDPADFAKSTRRERKGRGDEGKRPVAPRVGQRAPDFRLVVLPPEPKLDEKARAKPAPERAQLVQLSTLRGKKPVALVFGSYT